MFPLARRVDEWSDRMRLPEITYPLVVDTVGKMLALGEELTVYCMDRHCYPHSDRVNLVKFARRWGVDHGCMKWDLLPRFYCRSCREAGRPDRNLAFSRSPCTYPHSTWPRS
jgi:hypothetical protein